MTGLVGKWAKRLSTGVATAAVLLLTGSIPAGSLTAAQPEIAPLPAPADGKLGFVVTYFYYTMYQGEDACPQGMQKIASSQEFLAKFPAEERARLLRPENARELDVLMVKRGPNGENVCNAPWAVPDPNMLTLAGDVNTGLDLDGTADERVGSSYTCAHKQYRAEDGRRGIDNQLGRIQACLSGSREKGTLISYFTTVMRDGMWSMLIELNGVDDRRNDSSITVDIWAGDDPMAKDSKGEVLAGASLTPKSDPKFHRRFNGRIKDGIVEASGIPDLIIPDIKLTSRFPPMTIERPKLRLSLLSNGNAAGLLGGYLGLERLSMTGGTGQGEQQTGVPCDGFYHALVKYADGRRDPKTGVCGAISLAFRVEATPAFIVHPDRQTAPTFVTDRRQ